MQADNQLEKKPYIGRFAPSPTGALHAGSLVAALASYLDARAHQGRWLIRMEDVDRSRTVPGAAESIVQTLAAFGMHADGNILWQSQRSQYYAAALEQLGALVYPCGCSRREIADSIVNSSAQAPPHTVTAQPYPGICRHGMASGKTARAYRMRVPDQGEPDETLQFNDRSCGLITHHLATQTGDFVLRRADNFWAYQLAVVVDDAAQGITHVVRGMDLLDSTPRQIYLQHKLALPTPHYLHSALVLDVHGNKLSKHTGATALQRNSIVDQLTIAARVLGLEMPHTDSLVRFWQEAIPLWAARYPPCRH